MTKLHVSPCNPLVWERKHSSFQLLPEFSEMDMTNCWHFAGEHLLRPYFALHVVNVIVFRKFYFHSLLLYTCLCHFTIALAQPRDKNWNFSHVSGTDWICLAGALSTERCKLALLLGCTTLCLCVRAK
jgi:hypothetical protein